MVPTLEEWLQDCARLNLGINIELKENRGLSQLLVDVVLTHLARFWKAGSIAIAYGFFDELLQSHIPMRNGSIQDACVDMMGVICILAILVIREEKFEKRHSSQLAIQ